MTTVAEIIKLVEPQLEEDGYVPLEFHVTSLTRNRFGTFLQMDVIGFKDEEEKVLRSVEVKMPVSSDFSSESTRLLRLLQKHPRGIQRRRISQILHLRKDQIDFAIAELSAEFSISQYTVPTGKHSKYGKPYTETKVILEKD